MTGACLDCNAAIPITDGLRGRPALRCAACAKKRQLRQRAEYIKRLALTPEGKARLKAKNAKKWQARKAKLPPKEPKVTRAQLMLLSCSVCKKEKPRGQFSKRDAGRLKSYCKECEKPGKAARAARRRERTVGSYCAGDVVALYRSQGGRCPSCGVDFRVRKYHVDHIIPIAKGGRNVKENLQLLCGPCNLKKGAKMPEGLVRNPVGVGR